LLVLASVDLGKRPAKETHERLLHTLAGWSAQAAPCYLSAFGSMRKESCPYGQIRARIFPGGQTPGEPCPYGQIRARIFPGGQTPGQSCPYGQIRARIFPGGQTPGEPCPYGEIRARIFPARRCAPGCRASLTFPQTHRVRGVNSWRSDLAGVASVCQMPRPTASGLIRRESSRCDSVACGATMDILTSPRGVSCCIPTHSALRSKPRSHLASLGCQ